MFKRLEIFDKRYHELEKRMYEPDVVGDPDEYRKVMKEFASIEPVVKKYREYQAAQQTIDDSLAILDDSGSDEELRELAQLRLDNPFDSLRELGAKLTPPLSRSGVNHRLERIFAIARRGDN